ncbi:MAG TPA: serine hydrolase domain-containing protein [Chryseolinea sp.]|nr:serine hydrolase domain-containing protein [Chryseolinea sp.]
MKPIFLYVVFLVLVGCSTKSTENQSLETALDNFFSGEFNPQEPGGAVLVVIDDSIVFSKGYGLANLETSESITTNTLFNLGSISKTFVANGILLLAEQGKLSLEDSIIKYFPEFRDRSIAQRVKIKHLLTHTSGLPDIRDVASDTVFYLSAKDAENWYPITKTDSLLFEPGSQFEYSNPAYNGLALIIEKASGMKWQQFISTNIFKITGMQESTITDGPHPETGVSHAYVMNKGQWTEDDYGEEPTFAAAGNGGVWSSVEELALYERAIWNSTFLPKETVEVSRTAKRFDNWKGTQPFTANWSWFKHGETGELYSPMIGWSWFIGVTPNGEKIVGHTGSQGGFLCNYVAIPERKFFFVILCNAPLDVYRFSDKVMELTADHNQ